MNKGNGRVTMKRAAELLGMSVISVQVGMQCQALPIGSCWKAPGRQHYNYHISPELLGKYIGMSKEEVLGIEDKTA